jgi:DNA-binding XRE family transcriptional regulator
MHYDMKRMGAVIQEARIAHGMTQTALAEKIDISLRTVIAIETGKRNPTFEVLYKIIRELSIPADLIFVLTMYPVHRSRNNLSASCGTLTNRNSG